MVANKYAFLQITRRRFLNEWEAFKKVISRRNIRRRITDRKSGSAGMPRPISYAVFCLKKKKHERDQAEPGNAAKDHHAQREKQESHAIELVRVHLPATPGRAAPDD